MHPAIVFGGYGTFGSHVARELARLGVPVTVAGRNHVRAEAFARELGRACRGLAADVRDTHSCRRALAGQRVAVHCAGPFREFDTALLDACLAIGCHYADIADDRLYTALVRSRDADFRARNLAAVHGCSSLPGISGALSLRLREQAPPPPERVRVTLFVGNRNPKGQAAVQACIAGLGRPITSPQGTLRGFCDRVIVPLPLPFGARAVFNFDTPEYDLFPDLLGVSNVLVKLGFELRFATTSLAGLARIGSGYGRWTTRLLRTLAWPFQLLGCSGGVVMTEFFFAEGRTRSAAVVAPQDGQRMAALPCAFVARELCLNPSPPAGATTAYELLGAAALLAGLQREGFEVRIDD